MMFPVLCLLLLFGCEIRKHHNEIKKNADNQALEEMLEVWAKSYLKKINKDYMVIINFSLADSSDKMHIKTRDSNYWIGQELHDTANVSFVSTLDHFNKIFKGEITALTSMVQATSKDKIPLIPNILRPVTGSEAGFNDFIFFLAWEGAA